ncbi:MAG: hypothetical protein RLZZ598_1927 [Pseudomonadota bacterium]|jgi:S-adenosylmethionine-diacylglycerol 3-amino-3-carboxypropyl transferase
MAEPGIAGRARFDTIRYAQVWEDAEVLVEAMGPGTGRRFLSIGSAGDNALALLLLDPREVVAVDLSPAQLECLALRLAALPVLSHEEFLELMGARQSPRRPALLARVLAKLPAGSAAFWLALAPAVEQHGAAGVGRFERYFRLFQRFVLPLIQDRATITEVFVPRSRDQRSDFFRRRWDGWRWRLATQLFFSKLVMGRLGRDPAFFAQVTGSAAAHVRARVRHAAIEQEPADNPYLHWVLTSRHGQALPLAWRAESYPLLRERADRITMRCGPVDNTVAGPFDGFNLSDIFEYQTLEESAATYTRLLGQAASGARLVYWNMMVPRRVPPALAARVRRLEALERDLAARDKAFFYCDLVIEEVRP